MKLFASKKTLCLYVQPLYVFSMCLRTDNLEESRQSCIHYLIILQLSCGFLCRLRGSQLPLMLLLPHLPRLSALALLLPLLPLPQLPPLPPRPPLPPLPPPLLLPPLLLHHLQSPVDYKTNKYVNAHLLTGLRQLVKENPAACLLTCVRLQ